MPNANFCGRIVGVNNDDNNLVECQLPSSKCCNAAAVSLKDGVTDNKNSKNCRFAFASWCPVCDIELQRKRSKSESNDIIHRKRGRDNIKTFTPKKNDNRHRYCTENKLSSRERDMKLDSSRVRTNLCELPTSYIQDSNQNCQNSVPLTTEKNQIKSLDNYQVNYDHIKHQIKFSSEIGSDFNTFINSPPSSTAPRTNALKYYPVKPLDLTDRVHRHITFSAPAESNRESHKQNSLVTKSPIKNNLIFKSPQKDTNLPIAHPINSPIKPPCNGVIKKTDSTARPLIAKFDTRKSPKNSTKTVERTSRSPNHVNKYTFVQNSPVEELSKKILNSPLRNQEPERPYLSNRNPILEPETPRVPKTLSIERNKTFCFRNHNIEIKNQKESDNFEKRLGARSPNLAPKSQSQSPKPQLLSPKNPHFFLPPCETPDLNKIKDLITPINKGASPSKNPKLELNLSPQSKSPYKVQNLASPNRKPISNSLQAQKLASPVRNLSKNPQQGQNLGSPVRNQNIGARNLLEKGTSPSKNQKLDTSFVEIKARPRLHAGESIPPLGISQIKNLGERTQALKELTAPKNLYFENTKNQKVQNILDSNPKEFDKFKNKILEKSPTKKDNNLGAGSPKTQNFDNKNQNKIVENLSNLEPKLKNLFVKKVEPEIPKNKNLEHYLPKTPDLDLKIAVELNRALSPLKNTILDFEPLAEAKKLLQQFNKMPEPLKMLEPNQILETNSDFCDLKRQRVRQRCDSNSSTEQCLENTEVVEKVVKKKAREVSPTQPNSNLHSKSSVKFPTKPRNKLSSVKLRKVRSKIAHSVSSDSNLSESDASETEEEDEHNEDNANEFKAAIPDENNIKIGSTPVTNTVQPVAVEHPTLGKWPVRNSLFPHVPAYITFNGHDQDPFILPPGVGKYLKWKLSTITPVLVRKTLLNTGFRLVKSESIPETNDWVGCWGKHMKSICFQTLKEDQKLNHFPGTFQIGRKDRLWKNLQRLMFKYGHKEFGFIPRTYVLPQDLKQLRNAWEKTGQEKWIIKPPASARGTGIKVIHCWAHLPKKKYLVVQQYISNPYLINGSKFDLRLYVLVTSFNPLRIYLYPDGLVRFASTKYSDDINSLSDRYMHLTNYSINKLSSQYTANEDANACKGHKWTLTKLWEYMEKRGIDTKALWRNLQQLVVKTIIAGDSSITQLIKANVNSRYNCYELFGIDVLLDERLKPWLLEVNISPSLHSASPLDLHVKGLLVQTLLNLAQFHLPTKLQKIGKSPVCLNTDLYVTRMTMKEHCKHTNYLEYDNRRDYLESILKDLTGDDVRHLIQAEDELTVIGSFERIFPTKHTHEYFQFMDPRYYNKLFDAWETKYEDNRQPGIRRLQGLCEQRVHLMIAPVPVTKEEEEEEKKEEVIGMPAPLEYQNLLSQVNNLPAIGSLGGMGDHVKHSIESEKIQTNGDLYKVQENTINA